jgi:hypothetical protein
MKNLSEINPRHLIGKRNSLQKKTIKNLVEINPTHLIGKLNSLQKITIKNLAEINPRHLIVLQLSFIFLLWCCKLVLEETLW